LEKRGIAMSAGQESERQEIYQIIVKGVLDSKWSEWFGGMEVTPQPNGETILTGPVADQAALHGLLQKIRDMGLPLVSVGPVEIEDNS
jgi:hypothetical protein